MKKRLLSERSSGKGVGGLVAPPGVGLVDLTVLFVERKDCVGVEVEAEVEVMDDTSIKVRESNVEGKGGNLFRLWIQFPSCLITRKFLPHG